MQGTQTQFCQDRETLRGRLRDELKLYRDAINELQATTTESDFDRGHKRLQRAKRVYEAAHKRFTEHIAAHGC